VLYAFATYGVLWTIVESFSSYFPRLQPEGLLDYAFLLVVSCSAGLWRAWPAKRLELKIPNSDSSMCIEFGNLFEKEGCIAIQVNEFFDSLLGDHVSLNSLHGQFIRDVLGSQSSAFDALVSKALSNEPFEEVPRKDGNTKRYKIGTTASVDVNGKRYLLFALTRTDIKTLKASASVHELWDALAGLWEALRVCANGNPASIALVGGGLSGVGLPPVNLLQIMMISYSYYTKKNKITSNLSFVLHPSCRDEIDLSSIAEQWGHS
jgi:hypothetical protein